VQELDRRRIMMIVGLGAVATPFNDPGYTLVQVFNLAVGGSGGCEATAASDYTAKMLIDWMRVF